MQYHQAIISHIIHPPHRTIIPYHTTSIPYHIPCFFPCSISNRTKIRNLAPVITHTVSNSGGRYFLSCPTLLSQNLLLVKYNSAGKHNPPPIIINMLAFRQYRVDDIPI